MSFKMSASAGGDFSPAPEGTHRGVCVQVVDLGTQDTNFGDKRQIRLAFEIDERMEDERPFLIGKTYTLSLNEKANLRRDLESWRGTKLHEGEAFDLSTIAGKPCMVSVVHSQSAANGKTYANIASVLKMPKGMEPLTPEGKVVVLDLDTQTWGDAIQDLPEYWQTKILASPESKGIDPTTQDAQSAPTGTVGPESSQDFDDDIPF